MNNQILEFKKTDHFLYRQWDRCIDDRILYKILPFVKCRNCEKDVILVLPTFLKKELIHKKQNTSLVIILKNGLLLTCYWTVTPYYLLDSEKKAHFQFLH